MEIHYIDHISVEDYNRLRHSAGWSLIPARQAQLGLDNTSFQVVALDGTVPVGMARILWDGGYQALLADVVVHPDYQGSGIGRNMVQQIIDYLRSQIQSGERVLLNLAAAKDKEPFYQKLGFDLRPNEDHGAGMTQWLTK